MRVVRLAYDPFTGMSRLIYFECFMAQQMSHGYDKSCLSAMGTPVLDEIERADIAIAIDKLFKVK